MKPQALVETMKGRSRPPRGGRGLKLNLDDPDAETKMSPPTRGAWIETCGAAPTALLLTSPPTRGAWIETAKVAVERSVSAVAPHAGGVD